jgi:argininosuccinate lyase/amino-acid N-acetyltransferase
VSKLWGGRFQGGLDEEFEEFNRSLPFDNRLVAEDIAGSMAWARALGEADVLTAAEVISITDALDELGRELNEDPAPLFDSSAEDIHSFVEQALGEKVGDLAKKLHTGRSRNDQVATDLKLHLRMLAAEWLATLTETLGVLAELAEKHAADPMPGYTHLQRAQPITIGHHLLAYAEMFRRDAERLTDATDRMDTCPLGSGALAGTAFGVRRSAIAKALRFEGGATRNSLDAVSDRDHACELLFVASLAMVHISRLAEDWIFFASQEAGFMTFTDAVATGSSLMPQKKNPDAMELLRGKSGRVIGALQGMLVTLKGLPLAYDKDLQEDKEGLFDALDTVTDSFRILTVTALNARFNVEHCRAEASKGYMNATDLADLLVGLGVPFRDAHERTGLAVRRALELGVELEELPAEELEAMFPEIETDLRRELKVEAVLARRSVEGGTAPSRVLAAAVSLREELETWKAS